MSDETEESETLLLEKIEIAGDIINEPILSKSIRELHLGSKHRKISVGPFFCECGKSITKENATRCSHCRRLICKDCGILYLNDIHCRKCLKAEHQIFLTKIDYMILLCVSSGVASAKTIFRLTGIKPDVAERCFGILMEKYVTKEPIGLLEKFFPRLRVTSLGLDALGVFDNIYSKDTDCVALKQKLLEFVTEKRTYNLRAEEG